MKFPRLAFLGHLLAAAVLSFDPPVSAQPYRGSPDLEPGLEGRDDILLFEDFEYDDWETHLSEVSHTENHDAVTDVVFQGARSLVVRVPEGDHYGCSISFNFADEGLEEPEEIYFRYYVHIDASWELDGDGEIGKFPGFGGTYGVAGWGGRPADGTNGWSARMMNWDDGATAAVGFYTYHADMTGTYGTHMRWDGALERDRWYCIEAYARMNSITGDSGNNDGILRGWVDGVPVFERTDLRFRDIDTLKIENIWFNIYVGGSWTASHDMQLHFDNLVVARNPIGCYTEDVTDEVEPLPDPSEPASEPFPDQEGALDGPADIPIEPADATVDTTVDTQPGDATADGEGPGGEEGCGCGLAR